MSLAVVYSRANVGVQSKLVEVEVHLSNNMPGFSIVGLPETVVKESKDRVRSALSNCNFEFPYQKITVNLAPADLPKEGGRYDLAIALGILVASQQLPKEWLTHYEVGGEMSLSGELRPFPGCLPMVCAATNANRMLILPRGNAKTCCFVTGARIFAADNLLVACRHLQGSQPLSLSVPEAMTESMDPHLDLAEVSGQLQARRALEVAAAGGHSVLMIGTPGSGKTMLANRLPSILPTMTDQERIEVATVASLSGKEEAMFNYYGHRPFRAPHHSISHVALVGGGRLPRPGEISLAHQGVLFLDELPEFSRNSLEGLREPLESGEVLISRAAYSIKYPAKFQLIAAMNPCPCGYWGDAAGRCHCTREQVLRYQAKISGPLLDRIDLQVQLRPLEISQLLKTENVNNESSAAVRVRVNAAQYRQRARAGKLNHQLNVAELSKYCKISVAEEKYLHEVITKLGLSARAYHRISKVSRTIADLANAVHIQREHLQEAIALRHLVAARV